MKGKNQKQHTRKNSKVDTDQCANTLETVAQMLRELQLDTQQKHALLNELFNDRDQNSRQNQYEQEQPQSGKPENYHPTPEKPREQYLRRLRQLPIFDGESHKSMRNFIEIAQALNDSWTNEAEKNELIDTINIQLRGEARQAVGDLNKISFEEMKDKLFSAFPYNWRYYRFDANLKSNKIYRQAKTLKNDTFY